MSRDYSRRTGSLVANPKTFLQANQEHLADFTLQKPQAPFESIQKVMNFVNKKKKPDPSSHKSMQFPADTNFFTGGAFYEEGKTSVPKERKSIRSISRPKSGENFQNMKSLSQSRSFNSLSIAKNGPEQATAPQASKKQTLGTILDRDSRRVSKYLVPKTRPSNSINSYSFDKEGEEIRVRKYVAASKGSSQPGRALPLNKIEKQRQDENNAHFKLNLAKEEPTSRSFVSIRNRNNFSHNNSVLQDHSQFNAVMMIQDSSSEFNFESPLATNRGAQEIEFKGGDGKGRYSPYSERYDLAKPRHSMNSASKQQDRLQTLEENRIRKKAMDKFENEGNSVVITKSSIDGSRSNFQSKYIPTAGNENKSSGGDLRSLDLRKLNDFYEEEGFQLGSHSSFVGNPDLSTKGADPTYREKGSQDNFILVEDSVGSNNMTSFRNHYTLLETSHFNNNVLSMLAERDENYTRGTTDRIRTKEQPKNAAVKPLRSSNTSQIAQNEREGSETRKPGSQGKTKAGSNSPYTGNQSSEFLSRNLYLQQQARNVPKHLRTTTEPASENPYQMKLTEPANQKRMTSSPNLNKLTKSYGVVQPEVKKYRGVEVGEKKEVVHSLTPNPSSRNSRTRIEANTNNKSSHSKEHNKPRFLNPGKIRESNQVGASSFLTGDSLPSSQTPERPDIGSIMERIRKQTEVQSKSFQSSQNQGGSSSVAKSSVVRKNAPVSQNKSQDYNRLLSLVSKKENIRRPETTSREARLDKSHGGQESYQQHHHSHLDAAETFNRVPFEMIGMNIWDLPARTDELPVPPEESQREGEEHEIFKNQNQSRNVFEISSLQNDSMSKVLDDSIRISRGYSGSADNNSKEFLKSQLGNLDTMKLIDSYRNNASRDNTARSNFDKQIRESVLDVKIDEQEEEEDSALQRGQKQGFLSLLDMEMSGRDSDRKGFKLGRDLRDRYNERGLIGSFDHKYEFKPSFMADWEGHRNTVTSIVKDTTKNVIWSGGRDGSVMAWVVRDFLVGLDPRVSRIEQEVNRPVIKEKRGIECLMCDESNQLMFSGGADKEIKVWDTATWEPVRRFKGHQGGIFKLTKLGRNAFLSCSGDQTIKRWDLHKGQCIETWNEHNNRVTSVLYDREKFAHSFVSCSADGKIKIWDIRTPQSVATLSDHELDVTDLTYINGYCNLASGSLDKTIKIWDLNMRAIMNTFDMGSQVHSMAYSVKNDKIIVGADQLKIIHIDSNFEIETYEDKNGHSGSIRSLLIDNELEVLYTGSSDNLIKVWHLKKNKYN